MYKKLILVGLFTAILSTATVLVFAQGTKTTVSSEKEKEIRRMLQLTGTEKMMTEMKSQMLTALQKQMPDVPTEFWTRFEKKMDVNVLIKRTVFLYDTCFSLEDLRAINTFYSSEAGQRLLEAQPKIARGSMKIGMAWGKEIGEEAEKEAHAEMDKANPEK